MLSEIKAHAKINLHLSVLNRREDNYHNIISIMARVAFSDLLKLKEVNLNGHGKGPVSIRIEPEGGRHVEVLDSMPHEENLVYRAASMYMEKAGISGTVVFSLCKNIPSGAGLGGGSADAAAALRLLQNHLGLIDEIELFSMAASLGADVPFCLKGGVAIAEGTGERLTPLPSLPFKGYILLACPGVHVHTGKAYQSMQRGQAVLPGTAELRDNLYHLWNKGDMDTLCQMFNNDFEEFVFSAYPEIRKVYQLMASTGPMVARMTGSGSALFSLYKTRAEAIAAQDFLSGTVEETIITQFCF